jgi:autotransporter passenger strand-loop-strand repeat protein
MSSNVTVSSGEAYYVSSGQTDTGDTVDTGGYMYVENGGTIINTTAEGDSLIYIYAGGVDSGSTLSGPGGGGFGEADFGFTNGVTIDGSYQEVEAGATADNTLINGGDQSVYGGGFASATTIASGGEQQLSGGTADATLILEGGYQAVQSGGTASGTTIDSGGREAVNPGGEAFGTIINGGLMEEANGALTSGTTVSFTNAGGILQLDASQSFQGLIAGFAAPKGVTEEIDLEDISFNKKTTKATFTEAKDHLSGTLTVTDGTHTATLELLGHYSINNFSLASDGNSGTMVTDPPLQHVADSAGNPISVMPHA